LAEVSDALYGLRGKRQFGRRFGLAESSLRNWSVLGTTPPAWVVLRLIVEHGVSARFLLDGTLPMFPEGRERLRMPRSTRLRGLSATGRDSVCSDG